jgi:hypothetical protein
MATGEGGRTRALRKYEAEAHVCATGDGEPPLEFYSPFGPMIAKLRAPAELVERINGYADGLAAPDQNSEFLLPQGFLAAGGEQSLASHTARLIRRYLARLEDTAVEGVRFENFWVVSQYAGTPSPVHFHSGDLSGVLYLKVPQVDAGEEERTYISGREAGYINFLIGGKQRFSKSLISFRPQVGDFYLFPGWLLHVAEPFRGRGERRSMAFNAFVKSAET